MGIIPGKNTMVAIYKTCKKHLGKVEEKSSERVRKKEEPLQRDFVTRLQILKKAPACTQCY